MQEYSAAANLCKHVGMEILLIDKNPYHQLLQQIHFVASGTKRPEEIIFSINWTAGIKGLEIKITQQIEKTKSGRIFVDNHSRIKGFENIFAIGYISAFTLSHGLLAPQLAQFAVRQARLVAKNIIRKVKGEQMKDLNYSSLGQILSLGRTSIGLLGGIPVTGLLCDYAEDFIIDYYIAALKNRGHGLPALVYDNNIVSEILTPLNFMSYATTRTIRFKKEIW